MTAHAPFSPRYGSNIVITPASTAAVADIPRAGGKQVRILNTGAAIAYVRLYSSAEAVPPVATTADMPIVPGQATTITRSERQDKISHISALGTTLQVMLGEGW